MGGIANIGADGKLDISEKSQVGNEKATGSQLNKDDFLLLLVTQMQYQDPLQPTDNTEYVAQLAQFSELEQMENLNSTTTNSSAYRMVGQYVKVEGKTSTGVSYSKEGTVDYVSMDNGKVKLSIDGGLYDLSDVVEFDSEDYITAQYKPSVEKKDMDYRHQDPQDLTMKVDLGSHGYSATQFYIYLVDVNDDNKMYSVNTDLCAYQNGKLTIKKEALTAVEAGKYKLKLCFNDKDATVDEDNATITVSGIIQKDTADSAVTDETTSEETVPENVATDSKESENQ